MPGIDAKNLLPRGNWLRRDGTNLQEIARLFLRLGEGMSLREASSALRRSVFRVRDGTTSRQANLAVNYLDAFALAVIEALQPRLWPAVIVIDATTLKTRGYRPIIGPRTTPDPDRAEPPSGDPRAGSAT